MINSRFSEVVVSCHNRLELMFETDRRIYGGVEIIGVKR